MLGRDAVTRHFHLAGHQRRAIRTLKSIPGILNVDRDRIARIDTDR